MARPASRRRYDDVRLSSLELRRRLGPPRCAIALGEPRQLNHQSGPGYRSAVDVD